MDLGQIFMTIFAVIVAVLVIGVVIMWMVAGHGIEKDRQKFAEEEVVINKWLPLHERGRYLHDDALAKAREYERVAELEARRKTDPVWLKAEEESRKKTEREKRQRMEQQEREQRALVAQQNAELRQWEWEQRELERKNREARRIQLEDEERCKKEVAALIELATEKKIPIKIDHRIGNTVVQIMNDPMELERLKLERKRIKLEERRVALEEQRAALEAQRMQHAQQLAQNAPPGGRPNKPRKGP